MHRVNQKPPERNADIPGLPTSTRPIVPRTIRLFRPYRFQVISVIALILLTASIGVVNPLLVKTVLTRRFSTSGDTNMNLLWVLAAVMSL
ncbi:MAG: hypothetical protein CM1200mP22_00550 [Dehalococcoidia bacterium]|nr:MAG: hypothetical protein CM1200mP22_00550 [Dehalococcoidia bacterium]